MGVRYDFSGWATRNDLKCSDGRTIRRDAFKDNNGQTVPLVWNHCHDDPLNVLGHALLENRAEGVYAYCSFNETEAGREAKELVRHGDVKALSIYANKLQQNGGNVMHGSIKEVSLVLAGANPGAMIDTIMHGDFDSEDAGIIYTGRPLELYHSDDEDYDNEEEIDPMAAERTAADVFGELTEEQQAVVCEMIAEAVEDAVDEVLAEEEGEYDEEGYEEPYEDEDEEDYEYGDDDMKHNVFEGDYMEGDFLTHSDMEAIFSDAKSCGSLKEAVLQHDADGAIPYGITEIDQLFPEYNNLNNPPAWIKRDTGWVASVMNAVHHTPFSRIKSQFADITADAARAKGYIKGNLKKEEVFTLLKRTTSPTTIYKKQKLDRDDAVDITDFDVVAWIKGEMRLMLDEEIARAILIGDGRLSSDDDHIKTDCIRPIWTDASLYTINKVVEKGADADDTAKNVIRAAVKSRKDYKGSGNPTFFTTEDYLTDMLLLEDLNGRIIYDSVDKLATAMRVSKIITVPVMENVTRTVSGKTRELIGLIVNLADYNVGADKGGSINMFEDFDIDYNQQKYLIETRCSGALTKPYSAIALEFETTPTTAG